MQALTLTPSNLMLRFCHGVCVSWVMSECQLISARHLSPQVMKPELSLRLLKVAVRSGFFERTPCIRASASLTISISFNSN